MCYSCSNCHPWRLVETLPCSAFCIELLWNCRHGISGNGSSKIAVICADRSDIHITLFGLCSRCHVQTAHVWVSIRCLVFSKCTICCQILLCRQKPSQISNPVLWKYCENTLKVVDKIGHDYSRAGIWCSNTIRCIECSNGTDLRVVGHLLDSIISQRL